MTFKELGLSDIYIERLTAKGINAPTEIQKELFAPITLGESVLGLAKTGTGKTLSYLAPLIERYSNRELDQANKPFNGVEGGALVWVLVPTRELATQVKDSHSLLTHAQSQVAVVVGGEPEDKQIDALGQARFIVATPGRMLDLLQRKRLSTRDVEVVVMDEADRLLDMGFIDDIRAILRFLQKKPQLVFVSATLHLGVEEVAFELGIEPKRFGNAEEMPTVEGLDHGVSFVGETEKFHALVNFIYNRKDERGIVFSNYREKAHELASRLRGLGCKADALSAQLNQSQRSRIVEEYRAGKLKVLVASDLAARGLDFFELEYVVNYDLPEDPATYVHRVGRTARAGRNGKALSLIGFEDSYRLERLERFLGKKLQVEEMDLTHLAGALPRFAPKPEGESLSAGHRPAYGQKDNRQYEGQRRDYKGNNRRPDSPKKSNPPQPSHPPKAQSVPLVVKAPQTGLISRLGKWFSGLFKVDSNKSKVDSKSVSTKPTSPQSQSSRPHHNRNTNTSRNNSHPRSGGGQRSHYKGKPRYSKGPRPQSKPDRPKD